MPISKNYINRSIDLCLLDTSANPGPETVQAGISNSGSVIAGPYKVAQKFLKFLLTEANSVLAEPDYGTDFIVKLLSGQIQNEAELNLRFYKEVDSIVTYIANSNTNPSSDEKLIAANLESFSIMGDYATLRIQLTFEDQSTILAPVKISTI
jgi:hypothetical protein